MATALSIDKQSRCPCGCGFYRDKTLGEDNEGHYKAEAIVCWASAARERFNQRERVRPPGELVVVRRRDEDEDDDED